tara:strand:+ start:17813 stop:18043 length:231 start_codon:yes stop_codon:yes gene_type:complete
MNTRQDPLLLWLKRASEDQIRETGSTRGYLLQIGYGNKKASPEISARLEAATGGEVTRKQLRPGDWSVIWPELVAA